MSATLVKPWRLPLFDLDSRAVRISSVAGIAKVFSFEVGARDLYRSMEGELEGLGAQEDIRHFCLHYLGYTDHCDCGGHVSGILLVRR